MSDTWDKDNCYSIRFKEKGLFGRIYYSHVKEYKPFQTKNKLYDISSKLIKNNREIYDICYIVKLDSWHQIISPPLLFKEFIVQNIEEAIAVTDNYITDNYINLYSFIDSEKQIKINTKLLLRLISINPSCIRITVVESITKEMILAVVNSTNVLSFLDLNNHTTINYKKYIVNKFPELLPKLVLVFSPSIIKLKYGPIETELLKRIIKKNRECFQYIPEPLITQEICDFTIDLYPFMFNNIPTRFITVKICIKALLNWDASQIETIYDEQVLSEIEKMDKFKDLVKKTRLSRMKKIKEQTKFVGAQLIELAILKKEICPISFEPITSENAIVTHCGHIFVKEPLEVYLRAKDICPLCKVKLCE